MKKLLTLILIALLVILCVYTAVEGFSIGPVEILGIQGIKEKNNQLDALLEKATYLANVDYKQVCNELEINTKKLKQEQQNYEDMTAISSGEDIQAANQIEKYEYDSLMIKLGRHATSQGADLNISVETGSTEGIYNLKFEAEGRYISIVDFISAIENDSTLGFKIEDFKMVPVTSGSKEDTDQRVRGTFTCRAIAIEKMAEVPQADTAAEEGEENTNTTNSTNTTNTSNSTNTTNGTNTTNTSNTTKN